MPSHVRARGSDGVRSPPNRASATISRHSPSGQASSNSAAWSAVTKCIRSGFDMLPPFSSRNGFRSTSPSRSAALKNCFAYTTARLAVAGA
ncbi:hypothetical protein [Gemmata sp.]|uniref:hypothetical protein n=1 Tax=Gemmata sp. TaxID=1914242 RepID=UPI003F7001DB